MKYRKISELHKLPNNPRTIRNRDFEILCKSIQDNPDYFEARPLILSDRTGKLVIIAGNQRYEAAKHLKMNEVPTYLIENLTELREREIVIRDNISNGDWDFEAIANEWNTDELQEWGLFVPEMAEIEEPESSKNEDDEDEEPEKAEWVPDCLFASDNPYDIPVLKMSKENVYLQLPFKPYGMESRAKTGVGTYHFYVDDYRFNAIWNDPTKIINSGCGAIVEPNCSLYETTPIGYGIFLIYKKRWIARLLQDYGIDVFVDLNVTEKFHKYNILGIPKGYNAFFTRGYDNRLNALEKELQIAKEISGLEKPNFCVYGGSKKVKDFCNKHSLTFVNNTTLDLE